MARDDFTAATKRLIAQSSGYVCAFEDCSAPTVGPSLDGKSSVNVGVAAHICGAAEGGPRFDKTQTSEERSAASNGIWMCGTHSVLIDRDVEQFPVEKLRRWKGEAEAHALKMIGQPAGCAAGTIANASPVGRVGAEYCVLVEGQPIPYTANFDGDTNDGSMTYFASAYAIQFSIQKLQNLKHAVVHRLIVTVHETKPVPKYQPLLGVYPCNVDLFYVEIDKNNGTIPRDFTPTRFYTAQTDTDAESHNYPNPLILDDDIPAQIALRFNAKSSGFYLISLSVDISSGDQRERLQVMPSQWVIFETIKNNPDADW